MNIEIPNFSEKMITKRSALRYVSSIYDHLGLISFSHIIRKLIYRDSCDQKIPWDEEILHLLKSNLRNAWRT